MASSPYQTLGDIREAVIKDAKESTGSTFVALVNRWINEGLEQVVFRKKRDWLDTRYTYQVNAAVEEDCSVVENSVTVTFETGTTFFTGVERQFHSKAYNEVYDVASSTLNVVTLSKPYLGDSSTSATGVVFQPHILLSDDIRQVYQVYHQHDAQPLVELGPQQMRDLQASSGVQLGFAKYYSIFGESSGQRRLVLYPYPEEAYTLYIDVNTFATELTSADDEPQLPIQYRQILYWYGLYKLWLYHRNSEQAANALNNFNSMLARIDGEMRAEIEFPQISNSYVRSRRRTRFKAPFDKRLRED